MPRTFDYVIVGAGSAGAIVARRLAEDASLSILLIEAGPWSRNWRIRMPGAVRENFRPGARYISWYTTKPQPHLANREILHPRGFCVGGSSSINGMVYLRGNPLDYDGWEADGTTGWSFADVLPYFKRMETFEGGADDFRGGDGPIRTRKQRKLGALNTAFLAAGRSAGHAETKDVNGYQQEGMCRFDMNVGGGIRSGTSEAFLTNLPPNLHVEANSLVGRVLIEKGCAVGVEILRGSQLETVRSSREVILSAGVFISPKLLMLSGIGPADHLRNHGIRPVLDLPGVGRNLQDHAEILLEHECLVPSASLNSALTWHNIARTGIEWFLFKSGLGAVTQCQVGAHLRSEPDIPFPNLQIYAFPIVFNGWVPRRDVNGFRIGLSQMRPASRGEITLRSADPRDAPVINPKYLSEESDRRELRDAFKIGREILSQPAMDHLRGPAMRPLTEPRTQQELDRFISETAGTSYHPVGTCRMGTDHQSVVDPQTRVHGIGNLRVIDASIMPRVVSCNTNAASMMIGERGADFVRDLPVLPPLHLSYFNSELRQRDQATA